MALTRYPSSQVSCSSCSSLTPGLRGGGGRKAWGRGYSSLAVIHWRYDGVLCCVTVGVGTRNYYRKIGYELDGPYMSKFL